MKNFDDLLYACGMSISGASDLLGVETNTIGKWRTGKRDAPPDVMEKMEKLSIAVKEIFYSE